MKYFLVIKQTVLKKIEGAKEIISFQEDKWLTDKYVFPIKLNKSFMVINKLMEYYDV